LEHLLAAAALNLLCLDAWLEGQTRTFARTPPFLSLMLQPG
jgi:hypothetical protein